MYELFLLSIISFIGYYTLVAGIGGAPSVPSPKMVTEKMVKLMDVKKGRIYYDLGAGDARIINTIAKNNGVGVGFEYTPPTYLLAKIKSRKHKNARVFWRNFYKEPLKKAKGIFCFLSPQAMLKLEKKFKEELDFGTTVISYAFKMPNKKPYKIVRYKNYAPIFIYKY
jgi:hypothetical protein